MRLSFRSYPDAIHRYTLALEFWFGSNPASLRLSICFRPYPGGGHSRAAPHSESMDLTTQGKSVTPWQAMGRVWPQYDVAAAFLQKLQTDFVVPVPTLQAWQFHSRPHRTSR
jgi:hypothetical protein